MTTNDEADLAVLDMALAEELSGAAPPDVWPRLERRSAARPAARAWLVAALVLIGIGVVAAVSVLDRKEEPKVASPLERIDVDARGPASLAELRARFADARSGTVTANAVWSAELGEFVPLVRWGALERMFRPKLRPEIDPDECEAITDALRTANEGNVLRDITWTHAIAVSDRDVRASLLLQLGADGNPRLAFASPRGAIALTVPGFPHGELRTLLEQTANQTIATLGVVIGENGFAAIPPEATRLRLHRAPATAARELERFAGLTSLDLSHSPAWHDTSVLRAVARRPVHDLVLQPALLAADAWPVLGSIASLRELFLVPGEWRDWMDLLYGDARATPVPGLDDAAVIALRELRQLDELGLGGGVFGDQALRALAALPELRQLTLIGCTRVGGDSFAAFSGVTTLSLIGCSGLSEDFVTAAAAMPKLKELTIRDPGCRVNVHALRTAPALTKLHLAARVAPDELRLLADCATLRSLALQLEPPLRDEDLIWLHGLQQLRSLRIASDAVTAEGRAALRAALPRCTISDEIW